MIEWNDDEIMVRDMVRDWIGKEVRPVLDELDSGELLPYDLIRNLYTTFGMRDMAASSFDARIEKEKAGVAPEPKQDKGDASAAFTLLPIVELCKVSPGLVTAMGVSLGLAAGTIMKRGTVEQKLRWGRDLQTFDKIGAWAITEPDSGSDAFGGMKSTAKEDGEGGWILNGNKTFITNGPNADTIVFYAKLDDGRPIREREILCFVLDSGMEGLVQSKPLRKMGCHSSPTGELFLSDVRVGRDRLLEGGGTGKESAKANFTTERAGVAAMALGVIEECLRLSVDYAKSRVAWGKPIADYQLIQLKLAKMEVARVNVQNMVFRHVEMQKAGRTPTLAEASAMKLYSAQAASEVAMEAVQLFGGNGYMSEYRVEQLARDAKAFQIYAGTDELQITHIARDLLSR
ncbi:acyl-CoA dehydrogenase family protein [Actinocorallia lasiicapitis]